MSVDVSINLNAKDNASSTVDTATKRINKNWKEMHDQQRAVRREFELNNRGLVATSRAMQAVGSTVNRLIGLYNTWNLMQLRIQTANAAVASSQMDLVEAIDTYGEGSFTAFKVQKQAEQALKDLQQAQNDAKIGMALMATSMVADATRIATDVIPKLKMMRALMRTGKASAIASGAASAVGGLGAGGAATAGGIVGAGAAVAGGSALAIGSVLGIDVLQEKLFGSSPLKNLQGSLGVQNPQSTLGAFGLSSESPPIFDPLKRETRDASGNLVAGKSSGANVVINFFAQTMSDIQDGVNNAIKQSHVFGG